MKFVYLKINIACNRKFSILLREHRAILFQPFSVCLTRKGRGGKLLIDVHSKQVATGLPLDIENKLLYDIVNEN